MTFLIQEILGDSAEILLQITLRKKKEVIKCDNVESTILILE